MQEQIISQWLKQHGITEDNRTQRSISEIEQEVMLDSVKCLERGKLEEIINNNPSLDTLAKISILDMFLLSQSKIDESVYTIISDPSVSPSLVCDFICWANGDGVFSLNLPKTSVEPIYKGTFSYLNRVHQDTPNSLAVLFYAALESQLNPNEGVREHVSKSKPCYRALPNSHSYADIYLLSILREAELNSYSSVSSNERLMKAMRLNRNHNYFESLISIQQHFYPS